MKWVTRKRIQVNRTATCWLIRRFLDPQAEFIFVPADQVESMQKETGATGFDAAGATYPHKDAQGLCSFAALVREQLAQDPILLEMEPLSKQPGIKDQIEKKGRSENEKRQKHAGSGIGPFIFGA